MNLIAALPVIVLLVSALAAVWIMLLPEEATRIRNGVGVGAAALKLVLLLALIPWVLEGDYPAMGWEMLPGIRLELRVDSLSILFALLSGILWLATTIYAIGYLRNSTNQRRFFAFFSLCVTATVGIAFAGNLVTFVVFYEMLTLVTYPLVSHYGTPESLKAARAYLFYALTGGLSVLTGTVLLQNLAGSTTFETGGTEAVQHYAAEHPGMALVILGLLVAGFGVKAALVPLHGWLPLAMVAPAPVSALLHAVAVVKAGAFGLVRTVTDLFGVEVVHGLGALDPLLVWASVTILYGSVRALSQQDLKRRLAFSTVSQVSYITLGLAMFAPLATVGGVVHLFHQGITKIILFFCAGLFAERLGAKTISSLTGLGSRMPWTSAAFTVGAFGMIGLPPLAGFISKWTLAQGALQADRDWVVLVLVLSALLNCLYFLPIVLRLWWPPRGWEPTGELQPLALRTMLLPTVAVAVLSVAAGAFAGLPLSPLGWAELITARSHP